MALCSAFGLSACVTPTTSTESTASTAIQAEQASEPIDVAASFAAPIVTADFNAAGGSFRDGGSYIIRYKMFEQDGEILVCGAYVTSGNTLGRRFSRAAISQATLRLSDGTTVMANFLFFRDGTNIAPQPLALGVETVCSSTGLAAGAAPLDGFEMVFRQGSYRVRA